MEEIIDACVVVGGEGDAAKLTGLVINADTDKIVGILPECPAAKLTAEEITRLSGYEWDEEALALRSIGITLPPGIRLPYGIPDMSWRSDLL